MPQQPDDTKNQGINRREFVKKTGLLGAGLVAAGALSSRIKAQGADATTETITAAEIAALAGTIPMRKFGRHDVMVSALGVGGFHIAVPEEKEGIRIIHEAIDAGINFMDNAWDYHMGKSEERMGKALKEGGRRDKVFLMTKVCTHGRDAKVAMQQLEDSLRRLQTDHIDLWQIHEVAYGNDPKNHFKEGGVAEAMLKAKEQGKVRFLGFTGHKSPELHQEMLDHDFPFDAVQMPINPFDASFRSFEKNILPKLTDRGIAAIGMKSLGGTAAMVKEGAVSVEEALRYAMSVPVTVTVSGMDSLKVLHQNLKIVSNFKPLEESELASLRQKAAEKAGDGRFELYKVTAMFEGNVGREQHGFPPHKQVAG